MKELIRWPEMTATVKQVRKEHRTLAEESKEFRDRNLQIMIDRLKKLQGDKLINYANALTSKALQFMANVMHLDSVKPVLNKITRILSIRYRTSYCQTFWRHINNFPYHEALIEAIADIMDEQDWGRAVNAETERLLKLSFASDDFLQAFSIGVLRRDKSLVASCNDLGINPDSPLAKHIRISVILHGNRNQLLIEETSQLVSILQKLVLATDTEQAYLNYLANLNVEEWADMFMAILEKDLANNEHRHKRILEKLHPAKAAVLRKRINVRSIKEAFTEGDERLVFWLRFADDLATPLRKIPLRGAGASLAFGLNFGRFGIIEFSAVGENYGAAHFYWEREYQQVISTRSPRDKDLKQHTYCGYFFSDRNDNRMIHSGDWKGNWAGILRYLIRRHAQ